MARRKRVWIPDRFYHIVCRGNRRDPLFRSPADFSAFYHILAKLHERYPFELASYCLMTNHFHLQLRSQEQSISKIMALLNKQYANYYNTRYKLTGHVFENRFYDKVIEDRAGMLAVSHYIHLNPVAAKMVENPVQYPWSSYRFFHEGTSKQIPGYMNIDCILDFFVGSLEERKQMYRELVVKEIGKAVMSK